MSDQPNLNLPKAPLTGERRVPITDEKTRLLIVSMLGLRAAHTILRDEGKFAHDLAGMRVARTLIDSHYNELESALQRRLVRIMAAAGIDLTAWQAWQFAGTDTVICRPIRDTLEDGDQPSPNGV